MNAEGAFKAIEDAVKYLGDNGYVEGLLVLRATEKSGTGRMMQLIAGTMNPEHLTEICKASDVMLTRAEWYEIYRAAGHYLP